MQQRRFVFWVLLLCAVLFASASDAALVYSATPGSNYQALQAATVSGSINVRISPDPPSGTWTFRVDNIVVNSQSSPPLGMPDDLALYDTRSLSDGAHTVTATSGTTVQTATFTVSNGVPNPPPPPAVGVADLSWIAPTQNTNGTPIACALSYDVQQSPSFAVVASTSALNYHFGNVPVGTTCWRVVAKSACTQPSDPSAQGCKTITAEPPPCGAAPANESRVQSCPIGTTGTWTQAHGWASAPAPICWTAAPWQPSTPPAGSCVTVPCTHPPSPETSQLLACQPPMIGNWTQTRACVESECPLAGGPTTWDCDVWQPFVPPDGVCASPPPAPWKVKPITGSTTRPAYEAVRNLADTAWVKGYQLGSIDVGKPCYYVRQFGTATTPYHPVSEADVVLLSPTYRGRTLVAVCVPQ